MINHKTHIEFTDHQKDTRISKFLQQATGYLVASITNTYIKISARSHLKSLGAGGTTAKPRKPSLIFGFAGAFQFMLMVTLMDSKIE